MSRNGSSASVSSRKSEPGWLTAMNERSRASSVPEPSSAKSSGGFSKLFGKKKEKKDAQPLVITSKHAGTVKNKLAHDPRFNSARRESAPVHIAAGRQNVLHISAGEQGMRHPHSGPPTLHAPTGKSDLAMLTRIVSGDDADEPDEWEKMRENWRQRKELTFDSDIVEGVAVDGQGSEQRRPTEKDIEVPPSEIVERQGVRILSVAGMTGDEYEPRPARPHTPIGGRWRKDEKGAWKR